MNLWVYIALIPIVWVALLILLFVVMSLVEFFDAGIHGDYLDIFINALCVVTGILVACVVIVAAICYVYAFYLWAVTW